MERAASMNEVLDMWRNGYVAGHGVPEPAPEAVATDGSDYGDAQLPEMGELVGVVGVAVPPVLDVVADFEARGVGRGTAILPGLDVVTRGEGSAGPGQDDDAHFGVGVRLVNGQANLLDLMAFSTSGLFRVTLTIWPVFS